MARFYPSGGAGGGVGSDELTATLSDVVKGKTVVAGDTGDEIGTGTLELTGNAGTGDVVENKEFYTTDPKKKQAGTLKDKNGTTQAATASLDTTNSRVQMAIPVLGRYNTSSKLYVAFATLASLIGLTAAKLKVGNTILGIAGTFCNDATLVSAANLRKGVIAYGKNGAKYTGTMAERGAATITPSKSVQTIAADQYLTGVQTIAAIPSKYVDLSSGATVFLNGQFLDSNICDGFCPYKFGWYATTNTFKMSAAEIDPYYLVASTHYCGLKSTINVTSLSKIKITGEVVYARHDDGEDDYLQCDTSAWVGYLVDPTTMTTTLQVSQHTNNDGDKNEWKKGDTATVTLDCSSITGHQLIIFKPHATSGDDDLTMKITKIEIE